MQNSSNRNFSECVRDEKTPKQHFTENKEKLYDYIMGAFGNRPLKGQYLVAGEALAILTDCTGMALEIEVGGENREIRKPKRYFYSLGNINNLLVLLRELKKRYHEEFVWL